MPENQDVVLFLYLLISCLIEEQDKLYILQINRRDADDDAYIRSLSSITFHTGNILAFYMFWVWQQ